MAFDSFRDVAGSASMSRSPSTGFPVRRMPVYMMGKIWALALMSGFFSILTLPAADTNVPPVTDARVDAFIQEWHSYGSRYGTLFEFPHDPADIPLILAAMAKEPDPRWPEYLARQMSWTWQIDPATTERRKFQGREREEAAAKNVPILIKADQILATNIQIAPARKIDLSLKQDQIRGLLILMLLQAGPAYLPEAQAQAEMLLAHLPPTNFPSYGREVYTADQLLGHVALREGRLQAARDYLRACGRAPSSPMTYYPDHQLARELLQHGEPADRETVLAYLADIANYWEHMPPDGPLVKQAVVAYLKQIAQAKEDVNAGKIPASFQWY